MGKALLYRALQNREGRPGRNSCGKSWLTGVYDPSSLGRKVGARRSSQNLTTRSFVSLPRHLCEASLHPRGIPCGESSLSRSALLLLVGCGPAGHGKGIVKGTITYKGQPVNGAPLKLYPAYQGGDIYIGDSRRTRTAPSARADVPPGDYKIVVQGATGTNGMPPPRKAPTRRCRRNMRK